jgi:hypothetical protein
VSTQISPQMRIVALVGVVLVILAGGSLFFLRHAKSTPTIVSTPAKTAPSVTTHAVTTPAVTIAQVQAKPRPTRLSRVDKQLPPVLRSALARHPVVVVGLYDPHVQVDDLAIAEAGAGAAAAHVGFVRVNLLDDAVAGPLTALLPAGQMLPSPGILVYRFPGKVVYRFDGYLDREAIAQAVATAK